MWTVVYLYEVSLPGWYVVDFYRVPIAGAYGTHAEAVEAIQTMAFRAARGWKPYED